MTNTCSNPTLKLGSSKDFACNLIWGCCAMPNVISTEECFRRSSKVVSRQMEGETLVVPIRGGVGDLDAIFSFNALGSDLWALLEQRRSLPEMTAWVVERYEVTHEQAGQDIQAFLSELKEAGLVISEAAAE